MIFLNFETLHFPDVYLVGTKLSCNYYALGFNTFLGEVCLLSYSQATCFLLGV